jgi:hypothetical protein
MPSGVPRGRKSEPDPGPEKARSLWYSHRDETVDSIEKVGNSAHCGALKTKKRTKNCLRVDVDVAHVCRRTAILNNGAGLHEL